MAKIHIRTVSDTSLIDLVLSEFHAMKYLQVSFGFIIQKSKTSTQHIYNLYNPLSNNHR